MSIKMNKRDAIVRGTAMKSETPHEAAKRIAQRLFPEQPTRQQLARADIEAALVAERERCAKIAEADLEISDAPAARRIADAIRGSKD